MDTPWITGNTESRRRLRRLVDEITDDELNLVINKEGWTVATTLGHLAFWDERRLALVKWWRRNGVEFSDIAGIDMHTTNDALEQVFLAMPVRTVVELAVDAAEKLDRELACLPPETIREIESLNDSYALDRAMHRNLHLDEIDACRL